MGKANVWMADRHTSIGICAGQQSNMHAGVDRASLFNDPAESRGAHRGPERSGRGLTYRLFIVKIPLFAMQAALPVRSSPVCYRAH